MFLRVPDFEKHSGEYALKVYVPHRPHSHVSRRMPAARSGSTPLMAGTAIAEQVLEGGRYAAGRDRQMYVRQRSQIREVSGMGSTQVCSGPAKLGVESLSG